MTWLNSWTNKKNQFLYEVNNHNTSVYELTENTEFNTSNKILSGPAQKAPSNMAALVSPDSSVCGEYPEHSELIPFLKYVALKPSDRKICDS